MVLLSSLSRSLSVVVYCFASSSLATLNSRQSAVPTVNVRYIASLIQVLFFQKVARELRTAHSFDSTHN